jgi:hypothetical protein
MRFRLFVFSLLILGGALQPFQSQPFKSAQLYAEPPKAIEVCLAGLILTSAIGIGFMFLDAYPTSPLAPASSAPLEVQDSLAPIEGVELNEGILPNRYFAALLTLHQTASLEEFVSRELRQTFKSQESFSDLKRFFDRKPKLVREILQEVPSGPLLNLDQHIALATSHQSVSIRNRIYLYRAGSDYLRLVIREARHSNTATYQVTEIVFGSSAEIGESK